MTILFIFWRGVKSVLFFFFYGWIMFFQGQKEYNFFSILPKLRVLYGTKHFEIGGFQY